MEVTVNCPFCREVKQHFYLNTEKGVGHCFKCGRSAKIAELVGMLGKDGYRLLRGTFRQSRQVNPNLPNAPGELVLDGVLAGGLAANEAYSYLRQRGVLLTDMSYLGIRYSASQHGISIWFPVYGVGLSAPLWYQERRLAGGYYMPKDNPFVRYSVFRTFGVPTLTTPEEVVILTEGIFDAIAAGRIAPAVALFGKTPAKDRLQVLPYLAKKIIVWLDSDAQHEALQLVFRLRHLFPSLQVVGVEFNKQEPDIDELPIARREAIVQPYLQLLKGETHE